MGSYNMSLTSKEREEGEGRRGGKRRGRGRGRKEGIKEEEFWVGISEPLLE